MTGLDDGCPVIGVSPRCSDTLVLSPIFLSNFVLIYDALLSNFPSHAKAGLKRFVRH